jgi:hypothetical protein
VSFTRRRKAGRNSLKFSGRVRRGKKRLTLLRGSYRLILSADDDANNHSKKARARFRVVR